jgi:hypothetical protein
MDVSITGITLPWPIPHSSLAASWSGLPQWPLNLQLFAHIGQARGGSVSRARLLWLLAIGAALGVSAFRRRDVRAVSLVHRTEGKEHP